MEVRPGYRRSEAGIIPEDWESPFVGDIASFSSGKGIRISELHERSSENPVPVFGGNGIAGYTALPLLMEQTVIVGRVGQRCGEVYLTDGKAWVTDNALYPRRIRKTANLSFLALALRATGLNNQKNRNDLPLLTQSILHAVPVAWPPLPAEQEGIAEVLMDVDALVGALERLIAKKHELKQASMQQLLTGQTRLPGFSGKWEVKRLGEVGAFLKGRGVKKDDTQTGDLPCIRYGEIYTHHNDYIRQFNSWISPRVAARATRIIKGDLLFAGSGETKEEIGKCVAFIDDGEAYAGGDIVILRPIDLNPVYMGYLCNTKPVNLQKASKGQGDAVVHIGATALASIRVDLPPLQEQNAIAEVLADIDEELAVLEERLAKTRDLKQAMMQELLTGRIRLERTEARNR
jgi:type I restriction enzyme S subunit